MEHEDFDKMYSVLERNVGMIDTFVSKVVRLSYKDDNIRFVVLTDDFLEFNELSEDMKFIVTMWEKHNKELENACIAVRYESGVAYYGQ